MHVQVTQAARDHGASGIGFELDALLVKMAKQNVTDMGLGGRVDIKAEDALAASVAPASVAGAYTPSQFSST
jgi:23S rRNA G2445 N2-methylase RlmL